jgi:hypothetical protein
MKTLAIILIVLLGATLYVMSPAMPAPHGALTPEYYQNEAYSYFDSIDFFVFGRPAPHYAATVIRWEWHPWLLLTGSGSWSLKFDVLQKLYPTRIRNRNCTVHVSAPQVRCHVTFGYLGQTRTTAIYEEFTFNEAGEISFIEAWSDTPDIVTQAEAGTLKRMSLLSQQQDSQDPDVLDMRKRMQRPLYYWFIEAVRFSASLFK